MKIELLDAANKFPQLVKRAETALGFALGYFGLAADEDPEITGTKVEEYHDAILVRFYAEGFPFEAEGFRHIRKGDEIGIVAVSYEAKFKLVVCLGSDWKFHAMQPDEFHLIDEGREESVLARAETDPRTPTHPAPRMIQ